MYADGTYIVVPATNAQSRRAEFDHVAEWAQRNNLKLNRSKSVEIIFEDRRRKPLTQYLPTLTDIQRVTQIKILGITVTNHLSISEHVPVRDVICKCRRSLYAIKLSRSHGTCMCNDALKHTYRTVVLAKLLYVSPAWWGFATSSDKQHIKAFVRRGVRLCLYGDCDPTPTQRVEDADKSLFKRIRYNKQHVLQ